MMKFHVMGREDIEGSEAMRLTLPHLIISIRDPESRRVAIRKNALCRGVLELAFDDAEPCAGRRLPPFVVLMTKADAHGIRVFVDARPADVKLIAVHCEQGMSRSPAIAAALSMWLNGDAAGFFSTHQPNRYVYSMVRSETPAPTDHG